MLGEFDHSKMANTSCRRKEYSNSIAKSSPDLFLAFISTSRGNSKLPSFLVGYGIGREWGRFNRTFDCAPSNSKWAEPRPNFECNMCYT